MMLGQKYTELQFDAMKWHAACKVLDLMLHGPWEPSCRCKTAGAGTTCLDFRHVPVSCRAHLGKEAGGVVVLEA